MPPFPDTVRLPPIVPLIVVRFRLGDTPPWFWPTCLDHKLLWAGRRFAGDCIVALRLPHPLALKIMRGAVPMHCGIEVTRRYGVEAPLVPSSFFADWTPATPLLCPPFSNGRLIFSAEPAVRDLTDLADATNFATTYLR